MYIFEDTVYKYSTITRALLRRSCAHITVIDILPSLRLLWRLERGHPEVLKAVMATFECPFTVDFMNEELDKVETETLEAEQRQTANDARDTHVVVTVSTTTTTTTTTYDHEVLLFWVLLSGTLCHRSCVYRPLRSDSFRVD